MHLRALLGPFFLTITCAALGCGSDNPETTTAGGTTEGTGGGTATTEGSGGAGAAGGSGGAGGATTGTGGSDVIGGARPVKMYIPSGYMESSPAPLVVLLHGYGATGAIQEGYFGLKAQAEQRGFIYAVADGTPDATDKQFWNATDACCNFGGSTVDDSAYLSGVVDQIKAAYNIDPKRVYFVGHSNGGFMSYRMACDHADQIAAIVSLAGATFANGAKCTPSEPVAVAQIHGTADDTVLYPGGSFGVTYPGALETVETWATHGGCSLQPTSGPTLDLEKTLPKEVDPADPMFPPEETTVSVYGDGCKPGGHAELWTIADGTHIPNLSASFAARVFDFLEAHPKP